MHPKIENVFPHFVCRVAGLPTRYLDELRTFTDSQLFDEWHTLEQQLQQEKDDITDTLYELVGNNPDKKQRRLLLKVRRSLHNLRPVSPAQLEKTMPLLPPDTADALSAFQQKMERIEEIGSQLKKKYPSALAATRQQFQKWATDEDFQKGILLSSESLFSAAKRYTSLPVGAKPKKRHIKVERSLLRYFSRMAMKTTPFGTFCAVIPGKLTPEAASTSSFAFDADPSQKKSFIRINKSLYGLLLNHFKKRPGIREYLEVELNPTIRQEGNQLIFLAAIQNREVFQRLKGNAIFALITAVFQTQPSLPLTQLIDKLCANPQIDAQPAEAAAYLDKLLEIGFLRFRTGIQEQDANWDIPLRELLLPLEDDHAQQVAALLATLRQKTDAYTHASAQERESLLADIRTTINEALASMEIPATAQTPFYEDATAPVIIDLPQAAIQHPLDVLQRFVALTLPLSWPRTEQINMRHFFDTYYENQAAVIPLLQFYEDYYREHFKSHLEKQQKLQAGHQDESLKSYNQSNPFDLDLIKEIQETQHALSKLIQERWAQSPQTEAISISLDDIQQLTQAIPPTPNLYHSVSVFTQFIPHYNGRSALVMPNGNYMGGYGKYFSRFLYMFPDYVQHSLFNENTRLSQEYVAEICGDAQFNANLHPPLVQWEISYPTGEGGQIDNQIPSAALYVKSDPDNAYALQLKHATRDKQVYPVDLGFLNPRMRPPLYQLLSRFMPVAGFSIHIPDTYQTAASPPPTPPPAPAEPAEETNGSEPETPPQPTITYRPRILCEDCLVLARRRWQVPSVLFPHRFPNEKDEDYFIRVNYWRVENGIPDRVFIRIQVLPNYQPPPPPPPDENKPDAESDPSPPAQAHVPEAPAEEAAPPDQPQQPQPQQQPAQAMPRDLYKPQYIDFYNPLLVNLFEQRVRTLPNFTMNIEEMLPDQDSLAHYQDDGYVTEFILQLGYPDNALSSETAVATSGEPHALPT